MTDLQRTPILTEIPGNVSKHSSTRPAASSSKPMYSHRMLHVLVRPVLVPSIMMHGKSVDNPLIHQNRRIS
jgi:hypothetical protein